MVAGNAGKRQNQYRILQLLHTAETLTRQDIATQLNLSMPTTLQNTNELLEYGLLKECGAMESTGGRRARKLALDENIALGLGIDIELKHVELVITNLRGKVMVQGELPLQFRDETAWYQAFQVGLEGFLQEQQEQGAKLAVLDVPLLIETGWHKQVDKVWLVAVSRQQQIERAMLRSGMTEAEVVARINSQMSLEEKRKYADVVLDNSGSLEQTLAQVQGELKKLLGDASGC